jgi:thiamine-monophosphate kinase
MMAAPGEFDLIGRFFRRAASLPAEVLLGIGDDAALIDWTPDKALAVTVDTLVSGVHFLPDTDAFKLGHKALAVNLSDLAAMGAEPAWATLALTLPRADEAWLAGFSHGFFSLAARHGVTLIGGDTTRGPLSITLQVMGTVPKALALKRTGARPGDRVYLTGSLGSAGLGLKMLQGSFPATDPDLIRCQEMPQPRLETGRCLRGLATACIDVTDGLAADLGHILAASGVGAELQYDRLPLADPVQAYCRTSGDWGFPLQAGDDYELCFTVPAHRETRLIEVMAAGGVPITRIGHIVAATPPRLTVWRGTDPLILTRTGFDHFADA